MTSVHAGGCMLALRFGYPWRSSFVTLAIAATRGRSGPLRATGCNFRPQQVRLNHNLLVTSSFWKGLAHTPGPAMKETKGEPKAHQKQTNIAAFFGGSVPAKKPQENGGKQRSIAAFFSSGAKKPATATKASAVNSDAVEGKEVAEGKDGEKESRAKEKVDASQEVPTIEKVEAALPNAAKSPRKTDTAAEPKAPRRRKKSASPSPDKSDQEGVAAKQGGSKGSDGAGVTIMEPGKVERRVVKRRRLVKAGSGAGERDSPEVEVAVQQEKELEDNMDATPSGPLKEVEKASTEAVPERVERPSAAGPSEPDSVRSFFTARKAPKEKPADIKGKKKAAESEKPKARLRTPEPEVKPELIAAAVEPPGSPQRDSDAESSEDEVIDEVVEEVVVEEKGKAGVKKKVVRVKKQVKGKGQPGVGDGLYDLAQTLPKYDPVKAATWKPGEPVPFLFLARALDEISETSGRLAMTQLLCNVFRTVMATTPEDLLPVVYLAANKIAPPHEGVELGIGDAALIKALAEATGRSEAQVKADFKVQGDLGKVAQASRQTQRTMFAPQPLLAAKVLEAFRFIAKESGSQSTDKKRARIKALLVAAKECEPQYLMRLLQGKMRIGLAEQTVLQALAYGTVLSENPPPSPKDLPGRLEEAARIMKKVYSELPSYDDIIPVLLREGIRALPEKCHFTIGVPVRPMLAKPTKGCTEILDKFQDTVFTCEYKYDGERAQIHYMDDENIQIYSRNAENVTERYPDLLAALKKYVKPEVKSFVLDCEAVAYDRVKNKILPFQVLSTRGRKGVVAADIKVQVCLFAFDCLYLNGRALLEDQLQARRQALYGSFTEVPGEFQFAVTLTTRDVEEIQAFLEKAVGDSCEGLIVKTLETEATYEPSQRSNHWLKLKKDYMDTIGDTVDLVPIGGFLGRGKRTGHYGAFLLACYDEDKEEFQSVCKIGTGFSEAMLEERSTTLREKVIPEPRNYYRFGEKMGTDVDVWFDTTEVWEVKAADLSISPVHQAAVGVVDPAKGIALRFPRFLRVRDDKKPEDATSSQQIADLYRAQKINHAHHAQDD